MGGSFCQGEQILSDTMNLRRRNLAGEDALLDAERESLEILHDLATIAVLQIRYFMEYQLRKIFDAKIMIDTSRVSETRLAFVSMPQAAML